MHTASPYKVAQIVGHKDVATTLRYNRYNVTIKEKLKFLEIAEQVENSDTNLEINEKEFTRLIIDDE